MFLTWFTYVLASWNQTERGGNELTTLPFREPESYYPWLLKYVFSKVMSKSQQTTIWM